MTKAGHKVKHNSPNFKNGKFQNLNYTPSLTEGYTMFRVIRENFLKKEPHRTPLQIIPTIKTDLKNLSENENALVWFGHSSYFMQIDGMRFLIDPVLSENASPIPKTVKAFKGTNIYKVDDMPEIDCLIISHDHYDHLDYKTITKLNSKVNRVVCGLGVGSHLVKWGYQSSKITESDWNNTISWNHDFKIHVLPARHFSGRGLVRNTTLWCSYLLQTPSMNIYIGGDSGYDTHFNDIGNRFDNIDIAILENGQYHNAWRNIHMHPNEVLQAAKDLNAKRLLPVHSAKFSLSQHSWQEPLNKITQMNKVTNIPLITPLIGEKVDLKDDDQMFTQWWKEIK